ncbi:YifB family Mg chelatase-like AAA ATPase [Desulfurobacterium indicum]|uniref:Magnesium chelatase n=1 Tax=Desulfurobacterium indicum TaxID=1914305 RepID=A0A1R1MNV2_9BACT|nr:YifB family Mg chelatase-like AAA ATPase [Desulfurobacterium indicum]OMH41400.1 magnesium chelatase [Desulfurobacterium indicum]
MVSNVKSYTLIGVNAVEVLVQVDASRGMPGTIVVGLPDSAVKESRERVKAAIVNSGYPFPAKKIVINLAPADVKKEGTIYDLPISIGILVAQNIVSGKRLNEYLIAGELGLKGEIRKVKGALAAAILAKQKDYRGIILPAENAEEASLISGIEIIPIKHLSEAVAFLNGDIQIEPITKNLIENNFSFTIDMSDIAGQYHAKRAVEIAAAGGHNILFVGPPGSGKTMLSRRIPTILPPMTEKEIIETTQIYSAAGMLNGIITERPYRAPHHTVSDVALIGGGSSIKPGEVSLAHNGVLFLDEFPEFKRSALEALRQPIEDGEVTISRISGSVTFPAKFMLVAAMNPCPCGFYGFEDGVHYCTCSPAQVKRYRSKVSGPILDRIDIHVSLPAVKPEELAKMEKGESSEKIRKRVTKAHERQKERFKKLSFSFNGKMDSKAIKKFCKLTEQAEEILNRAVKTYALSARAYNRILKLSLTIADLDGSDVIQPKHIIETLGFRENISTN